MYKIKITNSLGKFESALLDETYTAIHTTISHSMKEESGVFRFSSKQGNVFLSFELMKQSFVEVIEIKE